MREHRTNECSLMAGWATDSFDGIRAGTVHRQGDDSFGRPDGTGCGAQQPGCGSSPASRSVSCRRAGGARTAHFIQIDDAPGRSHSHAERTIQRPALQSFLRGEGSPGTLDF
jgi:hypothetical protein